MSRRRLRRHRSDDDVDRRITRVYERHAPAIAAYALRRTSAPDASDVVADTFLVAWRRHEDLPDEPHTLPWLYGVARRVLANQRRSRSRRTKLHDRLRHDFVELDHGEHDPDAAARAARVGHAMAGLSADDAELLRLVAWEGLSPTEIATVMHLEPAAVRQRLRRARQRLRARLDALPQQGVDTDRTEIADVRWSAGGRP